MNPLMSRPSGSSLNFLGPVSAAHTRAKTYKQVWPPLDWNHLCSANTRTRVSVTRPKYRFGGSSSWRMDRSVAADRVCAHFARRVNRKAHTSVVVTLGPSRQVCVAAALVTNTNATGSASICRSASDRTRMGTRSESRDPVAEVARHDHHCYLVASVSRCPQRSRTQRGTSRRWTTSYECVGVRSSISALTLPS